jgi:hypothetical protein
MMSSTANFMWRYQEVLHRKNSPIVPGILMLIAGSLIVYRHVTVETYGTDNLKTFLGLILIQMLPLVALEMKIMSCADPVGLFCKFASPVTMMHGIFLAMRVCMYPFLPDDLHWSIAGVAGAALALHKGYGKTWRCIYQYPAVWSLVMLAFVAAACTEGVEVYLSPYRWQYDSWGAIFKACFQAANSYLELLAFVPAVWMMYREGNFGESMTQVDSIDTKKTSTAFFFVLVIFYFTEDVLQAYAVFSAAPVAAIAYLVHFLLLLDFAFYVLAHVYNPEKLMGELRKWLPADLVLGV